MKRCDNALKSLDRILPFGMLFALTTIAQDTEFLDIESDKVCWRNTV